MASIAATPPRASAIGDTITVVLADDLEIARRRDIVAKRARDEDLREEADARGWSSGISERSLALRRCRGSVSPPFARATTSVAVPEEQSCSRELASSAVLHGQGEAEGIATICAETFFLTVL
jgi:hypothetical protein